MVSKLDPFPEDFLREGATALLRRQSKLIESLSSLPGASLWQCGVNQRSKAIGYWIGTPTECVAYLIVEPLALPGLFGLEALRGWVACDLRGKGLFPRMMHAAAFVTRALISDRDGMTADAHTSWLNAKGFSNRYYDQHCMTCVEPSCVPEAERFTANTSGRRWLLVLDRQYEESNLNASKGTLP